jgi:hypothetical protein
MASFSENAWDAVNRALSLWRGQTGGTRHNSSERLYRETWTCAVARASRCADRLSLKQHLLTNGFVNNCGRVFGPSEQFEAEIVRVGGERIAPRQIWLFPRSAAWPLSFRLIWRWRKEPKFMALACNWPRARTASLERRSDASRRCRVLRLQGMA